MIDFHEGIRAGVEPLNPYRLRSIAGACPLSKGLGVEAKHIDIEGGEAWDGAIAWQKYS